MLRENGGALLELAGQQQLIKLPVHRHEAARVIVAAIDQDHAHAEFSDHFLVEALQAAIAMEPNQEGVKLQIPTHRFGPVAGADRFLVAINCRARFLENFRAALFGSVNCRDLQNAPQMVNLLDIPEGQLSYRHAAVNIALEQALNRENTDRLPHGVPRNPHGLSQGNFGERRPRAQLTFKDSLSQYPGGLVGDTDAMNLRALHARKEEPNKKIAGHLALKCSRCQVLNT